VKNSIIFIHPLIYCSVAYSLLKWMIKIHGREFNWSLVLISTTMTLVNQVIGLYQPFYLLSLRDYIHRVIVMDDFKKKVIKAPVFMLRIAQLMFNLKFIIASTILLSTLGIIMAMHVFKVEDWSFLA